MQQARRSSYSNGSFPSETVMRGGTGRMKGWEGVELEARCLFSLTKNRVSWLEILQLEGIPVSLGSIVCTIMKTGCQKSSFCSSRAGLQMFDYTFQYLKLFYSSRDRNFYYHTQILLLNLYCMISIQLTTEKCISPSMLLKSRITALPVRKRNLRLLSYQSDWNTECPSIRSFAATT